MPLCLNNLRIQLHNANLPVMLLSHCILKCFFYNQFILENFVDMAPYRHTHARRSAKRTVKMASRTACYPLHARVVRPPCCDFTHKESFYTPHILHTTFCEYRNLYNNFLNFPVGYVHIFSPILFPPQTPSMYE